MYMSGRKPNKQKLLEFLSYERDDLYINADFLSSKQLTFSNDKNVIIIDYPRRCSTQLE